MSAAGTSVVLERDMANVAIARRFVTAQFAELVPDSARRDLVLATSELVTNAIEHGGDAPVVVTARAGDGTASVTVTSSTEEAIEPIDAWTMAAADQLSGRGLGIVRSLATDVDLERIGDRVSITVHRRFDLVD